MYRFFQKLCLLLIITFLFSCSQHISKSDYFDIYSDENISQEKADSEIKNRETKITKLNEQITKIENYNKKIKEKIIQDNLYNSYNESLNKTYYKNVEIVNNLKNQIEFLNTEIRVIIRKASAIKEDL